MTASLPAAALLSIGETTYCTTYFFCDEAVPGEPMTLSWQTEVEPGWELSVRGAWSDGSDQVAFDREAGGRRPRADPQLAVNGSEMRVDGA